MIRAIVERERKRENALEERERERERERRASRKAGYFFSFLLMASVEGELEQRPERVVLHIFILRMCRKPVFLALIE